MFKFVYYKAVNNTEMVSNNISAVSVNQANSPVKQQNAQTVQIKNSSVSLVECVSQCQMYATIFWTVTMAQMKALVFVVNIKQDFYINYSINAENSEKMVK